MPHILEQTWKIVPAFKKKLFAYFLKRRLKIETCRLCVSLIINVRHQQLLVQKGVRSLVMRFIDKYVFILKKLTSFPPLEPVTQSHPTKTKKYAISFEMQVCLIVNLTNMLKLVIQFEKCQLFIWERNHHLTVISPEKQNQNKILFQSQKNVLVESITEQPNFDC